MFEDTLPSEPDDLIERGYERRDAGTSDPTRSVHFRKRINPAPDAIIDSARGNFGRVPHSWCELAFDLDIAYTLYVSDNPLATWRENCDYSFEEVRLVIYNAQKCEANEDSEGTVHCELNRIGERLIFPKTLDELDRLAEMLGYAATPIAKRILVLTNGDLSVEIEPRAWAAMLEFLMTNDWEPDSNISLLTTPGMRVSSEAAAQLAEAGEIIMEEALNDPIAAYSAIDFDMGKFAEIISLAAAGEFVIAEEAASN